MTISATINRLSLIGILVVGVALIVPGSVCGKDGNFLTQVVQWSEWGEYDKIVKTVPGWLDSSETVQSPSTQSQLRKHLGVAFYGTGQIDEARTQFILAFKLDPEVELDKDYVSREMYVFFMSTVDAERKTREKQAMKDSLETAQREQQLNAKKLKSITASRQHSRRRAKVIAGTTSLLAAGGFAVLAVMQNKKADESYQEFLDAANDGVGNLGTYVDRKKEVQSGDRITIAAASGGALFTGVGALFFIRTLREFRISENDSQ